MGIKEVEPEILRSIHGISLEAALLIDRLNKYQFYNQHEEDFKEFLAVDLADLFYYVEILSKCLELTNDELSELSKVKLSHFYGVKTEDMTDEKEKMLKEKYSHIFSKYKHARPY